ncbi:urea ABC transporter, ATP-binding protein UrtD (plasmid) [Piscirickettsia salmonis]|uniref:AAA family ATPase n=1 Tax=Piscirickettsia salmonis TaxID=1238 RepID=UPI0012BAA0EA|nr:AAA family ATPase [Piscirickettsia salmonis]QGP57399.1 urea ABC transporter, ATP-binding protein UrtD [Piscirickettsia salmonis]QGP66994.1 urea ABC transporter, ATP-binding protein UrtD [Piscirickettsia salmonis]
MKNITCTEHLSRLVIKGYKSIKECDLRMGSLNILIGANGAGKSNFIGFFRLIATLLDQRLQPLVSKSGGPDSLLYFGRKTTECLIGQLYFGNNGYLFTLEPTDDNRIMFADESLYWNMNGNNFVGAGHFESIAEKHPNQIKNHTLPIMRRWRVYHFHDTSSTAKVKQIHLINDNEYLREDGANLAAFLYRLKENHEKQYKKIVKTIRMVAPFFGDFHLRPIPGNTDSIQLEWTEKDQDVPFKANALSDGTLRFVLLSIVLLQPEELMPSSIIVDEPELGLHPYAIIVLAALIKSAASEHQLIISTQSVELLNEFDPEDLIVTDKLDGASTFKRLDEDSLEEWLEDYSLGELWKKNLLGGRPQR